MATRGCHVEDRMTWHEVAVYFLGGAFLANVVPHLVAGASGRPFPTPFAKPPFRGLSSPAVNVSWALANLAAAYVLLFVAGSFELRRVAHAAVAAAGFGLASLAITRSLERLRRLST
jgi:hypothetical protein